jgi:hypothetical protein
MDINHRSPVSDYLAEAVAQRLKENGIESFEYKPIFCDGIKECRKALLKASKVVLDAQIALPMALEIRAGLTNTVRKLMKRKLRMR